MKLKKPVAGVLVCALLLMGCTKSENREIEKSIKKETTLTGLILGTASEVNGIWTGAGAEKLWEDTGIRLEFYSSGNWGGKNLRQYMAAGTLPDFIGFDTGQMSLLKEAGLLVNLDEFQAKMPSVFKSEEYQTALSYCRDNFGGEEKALYLLPMEVGEKAEDDFYWLPMLQWKPYVQAGCPTIETMVDYLDVVEEMLHYKSTTPRGERVYGFSLFSEWDTATAQQVGDLAYLYGMDTGIISPLMELDVEKGELRSVTDEDSFYRKALDFYFEANQRGLLDPDSRTQSLDGLKRKYDQGRILFSQYSGLTQDYNQEQTEKGFPVNNYIPVTAENMLIYKEPDNPTGNGWYYGVTTNCRNQEAVCTFLNWLYEPENITYLYEHSEDMEPFRSLGLSKAGAGVQEESLFYRQSAEDGNENTFIEKINIGRYLKERGRVVTGSKAVNMLPETPSAIRNRCADIGQVVRELSWDMIYARDEENFQELWRELTEKTEALGMDQVEKYYQSAWMEALKKEKEYE